MYNGDSSLSTNQKVCWSSNLLLSLEKNKIYEVICMYLTLEIRYSLQYWIAVVRISLFSNKFIIEMYRTSTYIYPNKNRVFPTIELL